MNRKNWLIAIPIALVVLLALALIGSGWVIVDLVRAHLGFAPAPAAKLKLPVVNLSALWNEGTQDEKVETDIVEVRQDRMGTKLFPDTPGLNEEKLKLTLTADVDCTALVRCKLGEVLSDSQFVKLRRGQPWVKEYTLRKEETVSVWLIE